MNKFTNGPWVLRGETAEQGHYSGCELDIYQVVGDESIATIWCDGAVPTKEENATARLIAAAPEMYDAMNEFCERVDKGEVRSVKTYALFKSILSKI